MTREQALRQMGLALPTSPPMETNGVEDVVVIGDTVNGTYTPEPVNSEPVYRPHFVPPTSTPPLKVKSSKIGPVIFDLGPMGGKARGFYNHVSFDEESRILILSYDRESDSSAFIPPQRTEENPPILVRFPNDIIVPVYSPFSKPIQFRDEDLIILIIAPEYADADMEHPQ